MIDPENCPRIPEELGIQHLHVEIEDNPFEDIVLALEGLCAWVNDALNYKKMAQPTQEPEEGSRSPKVLVHCYQGVSRSGSVIIAYLMQSRSIDYEAALALAVGSRAIIGPNTGFVDQLRLWKQMNYSIYEEEPQDQGTERKRKSQYDDWKANRGILMSKGEEAKQEVLMKSMADMAARFGRRRLELKGEEC